MNIPGVKEAVEIGLKWIDDHFSVRYFSMFFILSVAFLFGINPLLAVLGLPAVPPTYRVAASIVALITGVGSLVFLIESGITSYRENTRIRKRLNRLSDHEKESMVGLTDGKSNVWRTWNHDVAVVGLLADKIVMECPSRLQNGLSTCILTPRALKIWREMGIDSLER
jgi:uncharacterized protein YjiS (DUF1127 family)